MLLDVKLTPKQSLAFSTTAKAIAYGGSVGSGKTFLNKIMSIAICLAVPKVQVLILRQNYPQLRSNYMIGEASFPDLLGPLEKEGLCSIRHTTMDIVFKNGAQISLRYLDSESSLNSLQGAAYQCIICDEATQVKREWLAYTRTRLRLGGLVIEDEFWKARLPRWVCTTNPGNISHNYIKQIFIDPAPPGQSFIDDNGIETIFIDAKITDNPYLDAEEYKKQIKSTGDEVLIKQLLDGSWDSQDGAFFSDAFKREKNVIPDFNLPEDWIIERSYDPGFSSPFGYVLVARVKGQNEVEFVDGTKKCFPNGTKIIYREWYGFNGKDMNVGLRWTHEEIAATMKAKEEEWGLKGRVRPGRADWKIWDGELNVYSVYEKHGVTFMKADKAKGSRTAGALKMRRMMFAAHKEPLEEPALFFVDKCVHCISTIPTLPSDPSNPDDVVTEGVPDHLYDAVRYSIMSEPQSLKIVATSGL